MGCGFPNDDVAGLESPSAVPPVKDRYGAARSVSSSSRFMNLFASGSAMSSAMVVNGKLARYPDPSQIYHTRPARTKPRIGRLRKPMLRRALLRRGVGQRL